MIITQQWIAEVKMASSQQKQTKKPFFPQNVRAGNCSRIEIAADDVFKYFKLFCFVFIISLSECCITVIKGIYLSFYICITTEALTPG